MITMQDVEVAVGCESAEIVHSRHESISGFQVTVYTAGGCSQTFFHDSDTVEGLRQKMSLWVANAVHPLARAAA